MSKKDKHKHIYTLELTERQARILSYACDHLSRIICGQDQTYQEFLEEAWEKRAKEATGNAMDDDFDGGWHQMRDDAEKMCKEMKQRFWGLPGNAMYGIHYDDVSDILFSLHQVIRHQLWLDGDRQFHGVDSDVPKCYGSEPLAVMRKADIWHDSNKEQPTDEKWVIIFDVEMQCAIDRCEHIKPNHVWAYLEDIAPVNWTRRIVKH